MQEVRIDCIEHDGTNLELISGESHYVFPTELIEHLDNLVEVVNNNETVTIIYQGDSSAGTEEYIRLWGLSDSDGVVYLKTESMSAFLKSNNRQMLYAAWGVMVLYCGITLASWYILSNAPKHKFLASMIVRKEWRNF